MDEIEVYVNGVLYPWSRFKWKRSFVIKGQTLDLEIPSLESLSWMDTLEIKLGGITLSKGNLYKHGWKTGKNVATVVSGFNYKRKLQRLQGVVTAGGTEASTHLGNQLADTSITEDTFDNYGNIALDYGATTRSLFMRRTPIEDLLFATGWEWNIKPDGSSNFKSQCGTDKSAEGAGQVKFSRTEGTLLSWTEEYVENGLFKVEKVRVLGRGMGDAQAGGIATGGGYAAGDPEITINRSALPTDAMCASAAAAILDDIEGAIKYGVARVVYEPTTAFDVFDTINMADERLGIDENLRVAEIEMNGLPNGGIETLVTVCNIQHLQTVGEMYISKMRSRIEDDYARTKSIQDLDDIDDGANYVRVDVDRGRPDDFGIPRMFRLIGEAEDGYAISESGTGSVNIRKDGCLVSTGATAGSTAVVDEYIKAVDYAKLPNMSFRFKIDDETDAGADRFFYLMTKGSGIWVGLMLDGFALTSITADGAGSTNKAIATIDGDTWYRVDILCRGALIYFYLNGSLVTTHNAATDEVPESGVAAFFYVYMGNQGASEDHFVEIDQYEVNQKW